MKYIYKIITIIALYCIAHSAYAVNVGVDTVEVMGEGSVKVFFTENPNLSIGDIDADIAVLKDMNVRAAVVSTDMANQVELLLEDALTVNTSYSLLSVLGAEGSIDFTTSDTLVGFTATNITNVSTQDIDSIEIVDDRTMLITYTQDLTETNFEYKLLAESNVTRIYKPEFSLPELMIEVEPAFVTGHNYILMFLEIQDIDGNFLEFDTGIFDFSIPDQESSENMEEESMQENAPQEDSMSENTLEEEESEEEMSPPEEGSEDEAIDLLAAPDEEGSSEETTEIDLEEAAAMLEETPDTGAATWLLIFATLIINTFYYFTRRKTA